MEVTVGEKEEDEDDEEEEEEEEEEISINGEEERVKEEKVSEEAMNVPIPRERRDVLCVYSWDDRINASLISNLPDEDVMVTNEQDRLVFTLTVMSLSVREPELMLNTEAVVVEEKDEVMLNVVRY